MVLNPEGPLLKGRSLEVRGAQVVSGGGGTWEAAPTEVGGAEVVKALSQECTLIVVICVADVWHRFLFFC